MLRVSAENQWFQRAQGLKRNRKKRHQQRRFLVEGVRSIDRVGAGSGWPVDALLYPVGRELSGWARDVLQRTPARFHLELRPDLMAQLSDKEETSELLAIVEMPGDDPKRIPLPSDALLVLVDRPASPGNLGTLLRSCDALGAHGLVITGHAVDLYDPVTVRASAGSLFAVPAVRIPGGAEVVDWLKLARASAPGLQIVGTSAAASLPASSAALRGPLVLALGNERTGLSQRLQAECDAMVGIPMRGTATSLNIATAATVLLYEVQRQRSG